MNNRKQWVLGVVFSTLLVLAIGCKKKQPPPPPPPPPPVTATLSASPSNIQSGQSSTLTWSTQNATDVTLDGRKVDPSGSQSVSPTQTTTYHLTAKGAGGTQDAPATITVTQPPPPPPTPTPTPAPTPVPPNDQQIFDQNVQTIFFDYDKADLRPESVQTLARAAEVIKQHPNWVVLIEGNCDERGSTEYNLALGARRAAAAEQALTQDGVSAGQLKTHSNGKEKPVCTESNEDCWQKNRNDHFVLTQH